MEKVIDKLIVAGQLSSVLALCSCEIDKRDAYSKVDTSKERDKFPNKESTGYYDKNILKNERLGLKNYGNTCYFNSAVQMLAEIDGVLDILSKSDNLLLPSDIEILTYEIISYILGVKSKKEIDLENNVCSIIKLLCFKFRKQEDSEEFLMKLFGALSKEVLSNLDEIIGTEQSVYNYCYIDTPHESPNENSYLVSLSVTNKNSVSESFTNYLQESDVDYKCECEGSNSKSTQYRFIQGKDYFIAQLKIFNNQSNKIRLSSKFVIDALSIGEETYFPIAVVVHHGEKLTSGHYTFANLKFNIDDSTVTSHSKGDDIEINDVPYMILYTKRALLECEKNKKFVIKGQDKQKNLPVGINIKDQDLYDTALTIDLSYECSYMSDNDKSTQGMHKEPVKFLKTKLQKSLSELNLTDEEQNIDEGFMAICDLQGVKRISKIVERDYKKIYNCIENLSVDTYRMIINEYKNKIIDDYETQPFEIEDNDKSSEKCNPELAQDSGCETLQQGDDENLELDDEAISEEVYKSFCEEHQLQIIDAEKEEKQQIRHLSKKQLQNFIEILKIDYEQDEICDADFLYENYRDIASMVIYRYEISEIYNLLIKDLEMDKKELTVGDAIEFFEKICDEEYMETIYNKLK